MNNIEFSDAVVQVLIELTPTFILVVILFIIFSWLRVLIDNLSGRGF